MNKINFKLVNFVLIMIIIFFMYQLFPLVEIIFIYFKKIFIPIILSFTISYTIYPLVIYFRKKIINKTVSTVLSILIFIIIIFCLLYFSLPIIFKELNNIIKSLTKYYPYILSLKLPNFISNYLNSFLLKASINIYDIGINFISNSINFIIDTALVIIMSIALLFNMDKIRNMLKIKIKNKKINLLLLNIDNDLYKYIKSISLIIIIETIEYTLIYYIAGHPYYFLLGFFAGITTIIPYFGALFTNFIAFITAINISKKLFIITIFIALIIPIFDNYLIDPKIMSKETKISFLEIIISIIISSAIFGFIGFIIAIPLYIIIINIKKLLY